MRKGEADAKIAYLCVSGTTLYNLASKFGGLEASETTRLQIFGNENTRIKRLLADPMLHSAGLEELIKKMVTPVARLDTAARLQAMYDERERRVGRVVGSGRTVIRYEIQCAAMVLCARNYAVWRISAGDSVLVGCTRCCGAMGLFPTARKPDGCIDGRASPGTSA